MPDYECSPIWIENKDQMFENTPIDSLEISNELKQQLQRWNNCFQSTFNDSYPPDSSFSSDTKQKAFQQDGYTIYTQLISELGSNYDISYQP